MTITIRKLAEGDIAAVRQIDFATGFFGDPMSEVLDDRRIFDRALDPFVNDANSHAFVAEEDRSVVGYAIASHGDVRWRATTTIVSGYLHDFARWFTLSKKDRSFILKRLRAALRAIAGDERRFSTPSGSRLHINLLPQGRAQGTGSDLLNALCRDLRDSGVKIVHANSYQTARNPTASFWLKNGFKEFSRVRTTAWRELGVDEEVHLVCYVRNFDERTIVSPDR